MCQVYCMMLSSFSLRKDSLDSEPRSCEKSILLPTIINLYIFIFKFFVVNTSLRKSLIRTHEFDQYTVGLYALSITLYTIRTHGFVVLDNMIAYMQLPL